MADSQRGRTYASARVVKPGAITLSQAGDKIRSFVVHERSRGFMLLPGTDLSGLAPMQASPRPGRNRPPSWRWKTRRPATHSRPTWLAQFDIAIAVMDKCLKAADAWGPSMSSRCRVFDAEAWRNGRKSACADRADQEYPVTVPQISADSHAGSTVEGTWSTKSEDRDRRARGYVAILPLAGGRMFQLAGDCIRAALNEPG